MASSSASSHTRATDTPCRAARVQPSTGRSAEGEPERAQPAALTRRERRPARNGRHAPHLDRPLGGDVVEAGLRTARPAHDDLATSRVAEPEVQRGSSDER